MNQRQQSTPALRDQLEVSFSFGPVKRLNRSRHDSNSEQSSQPGNIPRISRLMALAIKFDGLIQRGDIRDYADLARLGYVSRARITQIMNLLDLAPDIQEALLFLPRTTKGRDPIREKDIRPIAAVSDWHRQRKLWSAVLHERQSLECSEQDRVRTDS